MEGFIFFDTETTDLTNEAEIVQLALIETDNNLKILNYSNYYFYPNVEVSEGASKANGFTRRQLLDLSNGITFEDKCEEIFNKFNDKVVVGHNVAFDVRMLKANLERYGKQTKFKKEICTMIRYTNLLKLPSPKFPKGFKSPKLLELVDFVLTERKLDIETLRQKYNAVFTNAVSSTYHDALFDTFCTYFAFNTLK